MTARAVNLPRYVMSKRRLAQGMSAVNVTNQYVVRSSIVKNNVAKNAAAVAEIVELSGLAPSPPLTRDEIRRRQIEGRVAEIRE